jgi:hypothetical protein
MFQKKGPDKKEKSGGGVERKEREKVLYRWLKKSKKCDR